MARVLEAFEKTRIDLPVVTEVPVKRLSCLIAMTR